HEYLGRHFEPLLLDEVASAMATAKCELLGSIGPVDHHPHYSIPPGFEGLLADAGDPITYELIRDLILERPLRRDLFRRGFAPATDGDHRARLASLRIRGTG